MNDAPSYLVDPIALEEWQRVCVKRYPDGVPDDVLGPLAIYCGIHGALAGAIKTGSTDILIKLSPLVGQYRTLAAALFGRGSARPQPGKNPFAQLKDNRAKRVVKDKWVGAPKSGHTCDGFRTSGFCRGMPCGAAGVYWLGDKIYCGSHYAAVAGKAPAPTTPRRSSARNRARNTKGRSKE